jgi:hypothetical protein
VKTITPGAEVELVGLVSAESLNNRKGVVQSVVANNPSQFIVLLKAPRSKDANKEKKRNILQEREESRTVKVKEVNLKLLKPGAPSAAAKGTKAELREMASETSTHSFQLCVSYFVLLDLLCSFLY